MRMILTANAAQQGSDASPIMGAFVGKLASILPGGLLVLLLAGASGVGAQSGSAGASSRAYAIKVVLPDGSGTTAGAVAAPPDAVAFGGGFGFPAEAPLVTSGALTASSTASAEDSVAAASASAEVQTLSLFGGEITAERVAASAKADAQAGQATGDLSGAAVTNLVVGGAAVDTSTPGARVALGDWGTAIVLAQGSQNTTNGYRGFVTALELHLNVDHGGLPAGTSVYVGYAEAAAAAAPPPKETAGPPADEPDPDDAKTKPTTKGPPPLARRPLPSLQPKLTKGGYVFPVHGPASFVDTFGAPRAVVGWHHGEDIFAPMGAPVLAVADGTVFSVGWNELGGNRLWLRDQGGNEFYYAHMSAFSPLAVNGASVQAGDVLGFVGTSGDADGTPPHLHFEIHPVSLLGLGYDGVINPSEWLNAVQRLEDVRFVAGAGWLPALSSNAPQPGAYLLSSTDISSASGLKPGSLAQALQEPVSAEAAVPPGPQLATRP